MYGAILFDLGNVLIPFDFSRAFRRMENLSGIPATEVRARLAATDLFHQFETGLIKPEAFSNQVQEVVGFACGYSEFCEIWSSIFLPEPLIPAGFLAGLKQRFRLLIVSNTNVIHFEMLMRTYPVLQIFDEVVLSYKVGAMKPDPQYYAAALAASGHSAESCLFIDDLPSNVEGAKLAGMDAIRFVSFEELEPQLRTRRIF